MSPIYFQIHTPYSIQSPRILMLDNIWKAHDSSPWQNNFIYRIQIHNQSPWFKPMAIHSSKTQFSLATSKPNSYWQYQSPIPIGNIKTQFSLALLYQKEKSPRLSTLGKEKKYYVKMLPWQKRTMAIILWRNSLRATTLSKRKEPKIINARQRDRKSVV